MLLASLVVLHHTAITYGGSGSWSYTEAPTSELSYMILTMFTATNQAFFMGAFFLLAGFFAVRSFERTGAWRFVGKKIVRLGIPLLFYTGVISPLMIGMLARHVWGWDGTYLQILSLLYRHWWPPGFGPLWFVSTLSILCLCFALYRGLLLRRPPAPKRATRPSTRAILLFATALGAISFIVRLWYRVGEDFDPLSAQLAYYTQYVALLIVGVRVAYQNGLDALAGGGTRPWGGLIAGLLFAFPAMFALGGAMSGTVEPFLGGWHWQSLAYALWDQILGLSVIALLLIAFRKRLNRPTWTSRELAPSAYAAFILHAPVVVGVGLLLRPLALPSIPKFLIAGALGLVLCFVLAGLIRRFPLVRRVVG